MAWVAGLGHSLARAKTPRRETTGGGSRTLDDVDEEAPNKPRRRSSEASRGNRNRTSDRSNRRRAWQIWPKMSKREREREAPRVSVG